MSAATPYFRLHGQPGSIFVTFHAANGQPVWVTAQGGSNGKQGYARRRQAYAAIGLMLGGTICDDWRLGDDGRPTVVWHDGQGGYGEWLPIRDEVSKRRTETARPEASDE